MASNRTSTPSPERRCGGSRTGEGWDSRQRERPRSVPTGATHAVRKAGVHRLWRGQMFAEPFGALRRGQVANTAFSAEVQDDYSVLFVYRSRAQQRVDDPGGRELAV